MSVGWLHIACLLLVGVLPHAANALWLAPHSKTWPYRLPRPKNVKTANPCRGRSDWFQTAYIGGRRLCYDAASICTFPFPGMLWMRCSPTTSFCIPVSDVARCPFQQPFGRRNADGSFSHACDFRSFPECAHTSSAALCGASVCFNMGAGEVFNFNSRKVRPGIRTLSSLEADDFLTEAAFNETMLTDFADYESPANNSAVFEPVYSTLAEAEAYLAFEDVGSPFDDPVRHLEQSSTFVVGSATFND